MRIVYQLAALLFFLSVVLACFGWTYEESGEYTSDGKYTKSRFVKILKWELPPYEVVKIDRARRIQELVDRGQVYSPIENGNVLAVHDGKIIAD